jgi:hypothetical protein
MRENAKKCEEELFSDKINNKIKKRNIKENKLRNLLDNPDSEIPSASSSSGMESMIN